jgi:nucleotide-binding universal stress UspA family protein
VTEVLAHLPWIGKLPVTVLAVDDGRCDAATAASAAAERLRGVGANVDVSVIQGEPTRAITRHLEQTPPDLVAIGTSGLTGVRRLRVGSTAGAVVQAAECSALVACVDDDTP